VKSNGLRIAIFAALDDAPVAEPSLGPPGKAGVNDRG